MILGTLLTLLLAAPATQDKKEFRYTFEKGQTFNLSIQNTTKLKFEKIPDTFQGLFGDDPINLEFKGVVAMEVTGIKKGRAQLRGKWTSMKVKGVLMLNELDFTHEAGKKKEKKPEVDPGLEGFGDFGDPEEQFRTLANQPLLLQVDPYGQISTGKGGGDEFSGLFLSFLELTGSMPEVREAGSWHFDAMSNRCARWPMVIASTATRTRRPAAMIQPAAPPHAPSTRFAAM